MPISRETQVIETTKPDITNNKNTSATEEFASHLYDSACYNVIQAPLTGITQLLDRTIHTDLMPKAQFFAPPKPAKIGTAAYAGEVAGGAVAAIIPMIILHKSIGPGAASKLELTANYGIGRGAAPAILKAAATGALWGGVLTPSDDKENIYTGRLKNAAVSALSLSALTMGSIGLKSTGSAFLRNDMVSAGLAGGLAGEISVDGHSLLSGRGLAGAEDRLKSITSFAVGGIAGGAANSAREFFAPTSGIRGVRTLADMKKLADKTMAPEAPKRFAFEKDQKIPANAEDLSLLDKQHWYNSSSSHLREVIDSSKMSLEVRKELVSGHQDITYGLQALHDRPNPKPVLVVYGSARIPESDFRYQRARYIGGKAIQEGYDVMTGGGPGIMEAANRGAFEALKPTRDAAGNQTGWDGNSIGVVLKLPHEKRGNGYQTLTLPHRNFFTRLRNLKEADAFVIEDGGIGTVAEAMDTLTHIQTGKMKGVPISFVGKEKHQYLERFMDQLEKDGTISPADRKLYKVVNDPNEIFDDLSKHKKQWEIELAQSQEQKTANSK